MHACGGGALAQVVPSCVWGGGPWHRWCMHARVGGSLAQVVYARACGGVLAKVCMYVYYMYVCILLYMHVPGLAPPVTKAAACLLEREREREGGLLY